jgi:hypothetical protein
MKIARGKTLILFCGLNLLMMGCTDTTEVYHSTKIKKMMNGKTVTVDRTDELTRAYGAISGHLYGESHLFTHELNVKPDNFLWKGAQRETPKGIVDCKSGFFIRTKLEQLSADSVTQVIAHITNSGFIKMWTNVIFLKFSEINIL